MHVYSTHHFFNSSIRFYIDFFKEYFVCYIYCLFVIQVFEPLRKKNPEFEQKIVAINGDVEKPGLGMSAEDRNFLIKEVL